MFEHRIKILEESYKQVENKIKLVEAEDSEELSKLISLKNKYLIELRELRRQQYDYSQRVDFEDDR